MLGQVIGVDEQTGAEVVLATLHDDGRWETTNPDVALFIAEDIQLQDVFQHYGDVPIGQAVLSLFVERWGRGARYELGFDPGPNRREYLQDPSLLE